MATDTSGVNCDQINENLTACFTVSEDDETETEAAQRRLKQKLELHGGLPSLHGAVARGELEKPKEAPWPSE